MATITSHLLFLSKQESAFVLEPLFALSEVKKIPDLRRRSTFRSKPMLDVLTTPFLKEGTAISGHTFDLHSDTKLTIALQSEMPLDFDCETLKTFYAESGLEVYYFTKDAEGNFLLRNLLSGQELVIASDSASFCRLMSEVFDIWKIIYATEFRNSLKLLTDKSKTAYALNLIEQIMAYARSRKCRKEYCHFRTRETSKR